MILVTVALVKVFKFSIHILPKVNHCANIIHDWAGAYHSCPVLKLIGELWFRLKKETLPLKSLCLCEAAAAHCS